MEAKRVLKVIGILVVLAWLGFLLSGCGGLPFGANWLVRPGESIQSVINQASPGQIIYVMLGTYPGDITIDKDGLTLIGESGSKPIIDGDLIVTANNVTVKNFEITGDLETLPGSFANLSLINTEIWGVVFNIVLSCDRVVNPTETIQAAVNGATAGDTICVAPGTYNEGIDVNKFVSIQSIGGPAATTIDGKGTARPTTLGYSTTVNFAIPNAAGTMVLDGFTIKGTTSMQLGVLVNGRADVVGLSGPQGANSSFEIKNNVFDGLAADGAAIVTEQINLCSGCSGMIRNNEIKNSGAGIRISNSSKVTVKDNYIHDNKNYGVFVTKNKALESIGALQQTCENNLIEGNRIINNGGLAPAAQAYGALFGRDPTSPGDPPLGRNNSFINNEVIGNDYLGLYVHLQNTDSGTTLVSGNTFSGNAKYVTTHPAGGVYLAGSKNVSVEHNKIISNLSHGVTIDTDATGHTINYNNIYGHAASLFGVKNNTATIVNAENNWWGCIAGPGNPGCDAVSGNVDFTPWLTEPIP